MPFVACLAVRALLLIEPMYGKDFIKKTRHSSHRIIMFCKSDSYGVTSCRFNSSHRNVLSVRCLCPNVTSDEFIRKTFYAYCHPVFLISVDFKHTFSWLRFTPLRLMPAVSRLLCSCDTCPFMLRKAIFQRAKAYLSRCN